VKTQRFLGNRASRNYGVSPTSAGFDTYSESGCRPVSCNSYFEYTEYPSPGEGVRVNSKATNFGTRGKMIYTYGRVIFDTTESD